MRGNNTIRIGTRRSLLAMAQSQQVADAIKDLHPAIAIELVPIVTTGDRYFGPLHTAGGKGLFTAELEAALRSGTIDLAVHSAKDMPASMADDLVIAAVPQRQDVRDILISPHGGGIESLASGALIGTSSARRSLQLRQARPDLQIVPLRGNVETRLNKVLNDQTVAATVLAMAGLVRASLLEKYCKYVYELAVEDFIPAAGQGALAVQAARGSAAILLAYGLDDEQSRVALMAERSIVFGLQADCQSSLAIHVRPVGADWEAMLLAGSADGKRLYRKKLRAATAELAAQELLHVCQADSVSELLRS